MESKVKVLGHPVHQMLIPFPIGLLGTAVVFDAIYLVFHNQAMASVVFWMMLAGIVSGLVAAPFGFFDWRVIPKHTRAKRVGAVHGLGNVVMLVLFVLSLLGRQETPPPTIAHILSFAGFLLAGVTGWLGGELVDRHAIGVDRGAHLDSPHSLSGRPAGEHVR